MRRRIRLTKEKRVELIAMKKEMPDLALRDLGKAFGVTASTAGNILKKHKAENLAKREEEKMSRTIEFSGTTKQSNQTPDYEVLIRMESHLKGIYQRLANLEQAVQSLRDERIRNSIPDTQLFARQ